MSSYIFDKDNFKFKKAKVSVWAVLRRFCVFLIVSLSMTVLYYVIFALVFSTDEERRLRQENRTYEREFPVLEEKGRMMTDVVEGQQVRDDRI